MGGRDFSCALRLRGAGDLPLRGRAALQAWFGMGRWPVGAAFWTAPGQAPAGRGLRAELLAPDGRECAVLVRSTERVSPACEVMDLEIWGPVARGNVRIEAALAARARSLGATREHADPGERPDPAARPAHGHEARATGAHAAT